MNQSIHSKSFAVFVVSAVTFVSLGLLPQNVFGVLPAPDGGYPGGNTAEGQAALLRLTTGGYNTAVGFLSLTSDIAGGFNTALGAGALLGNTADSNTATGAGALLSNTTGTGNTASGAFALFYNNTGNNNTAVGDGACFNCFVASENTVIGAGALSNSASGGNIAIGYHAGNVFDVGLGRNIFIGSPGAAGDEFTLRVGQVQTKTFMAGIRGATTSNNNAIPVLIDTAGQLGTISSSRRFKKEIKPMDQASEVILALKPVTFHYKSDNLNRPEFGLIAEEVAEINPDLVVCDENGEIYTVRYEAVNAMLLNEFLKEHKKVQELEVTLTKQREDFHAAIAKLEESVSAQLKEQAAQIQKVRSEVQMSKTAPEVVLNR